MKRKTNVQAINNVMNFSEYGSLSQAFVMNAILTSAEAVIAAGTDVMPKDGFIAPQAWLGVAKEIHDKLSTHLKELA
jgi:hypothetical protein